MRHTHKREIDGTLWTVNQFSASEGLRLMTRLIKLCGSPIAKAMQALPTDKSILDADVNLSLLAEAIDELTGRLDESEMLALIKRLVSCTQADGKDVDGRFDLVFQGRYRTLFSVLLFVLEVNYDVPLGDWLNAASAAGQGHPSSPTAAAGGR